MKYEAFKPLPLPADFRFMDKVCGLPKALEYALRFNGLAEIPGARHEPIILEMGDYLGGQVAAWHKDDETAWCGVFVGFVLKHEGFTPPAGFDVVRARKYAEFGVPAETPSLGDILSFWRGNPNGSDGHVGFYVGETATTYKVFGGNQNNRVGFTDILKTRLLAARRCPGPVPASVRPILFKQAGQISGNEA